jgi:pimeloyl-ACP methyl ester carboxylesterase
LLIFRTSADQLFFLKTAFVLSLCFAQQLHAQVPIDSIAVLQIGGIRQVISVKGKDNSKPLLLFLHGGPGNSVMHYAQRFTGRLQEHFIVVQWDQRNVGRTLALNSPSKSLSVHRFEEDTHSLIDTLLKRFNRSKLYLAGHSWGTHLGFYMAVNYPELLHAYLAICPMINQLESEVTILDLMKDKAKRTGNEIALRELNAIKIPFENGQQLYFHRKWVLSYMGSKAKITKRKVEEWSLTWLPIFVEASKQNLLETATEIKCPVYFFVGRKDFQTNSSITEKYYQRLIAPKKQLFWFERSAHSLPTTEPEKLQEIIIKLVLDN